jgi:hypothetical protein
MSDGYCGNALNENARITCSLEAGNHAQCSGLDLDDERPFWVSWPNPHYVAPRKTQPGSAVRKTLDALAARVR